MARGRRGALSAALERAGGGPARRDRRRSRRIELLACRPSGSGRGAAWPRPSACSRLPGRRPGRFRPRPAERRRLGARLPARRGADAGREAGADRGPAALRRADRRDQLRPPPSLADQGRPPAARAPDPRHFRHGRRPARRISAPAPPSPIRPRSRRPGRSSTATASTAPLAETREAGRGRIPHRRRAPPTPWPPRRRRRSGSATAPVMLGECEGEAREIGRAHARIARAVAAGHGSDLGRRADRHRDRHAAAAAPISNMRSPPPGALAGTSSASPRTRTGSTAPAARPAPSSMAMRTAPRRRSRRTTAPPGSPRAAPCSSPARPAPTSTTCGSSSSAPGQAHERVDDRHHRRLRPLRDRRARGRAMDRGRHALGARRRTSC